MEVVQVSFVFLDCVELMQDAVSSAHVLSYAPLALTTVSHRLRLGWISYQKLQGIVLNLFGH